MKVKWFIAFALSLVMCALLLSPASASTQYDFSHPHLKNVPSIQLPEFELYKLSAQLNTVNDGVSGFWPFQKHYRNATLVVYDPYRELSAEFEVDLPLTKEGQIDHILDTDVGKVTIQLGYDRILHIQFTNHLQDATIGDEGITVANQEEGLLTTPSGLHVVVFVPAPKQIIIMGITKGAVARTVANGWDVPFEGRVYHVRYTLPLLLEGRACFRVTIS